MSKPEPSDQKPSERHAEIVATKEQSLLGAVRILAVKRLTLDQARHDRTTEWDVWNAAQEFREAEEIVTGKIQNLVNAHVTQMVMLAEEKAAE